MHPCINTCSEHKRLLYIILFYYFCICLVWKRFILHPAYQSKTSTLTSGKWHTHSKVSADNAVIWASLSHIVFVRGTRHSHGAAPSVCFWTCFWTYLWFCSNTHEQLQCIQDRKPLEGRHSHRGLTANLHSWSPGSGRSCSCSVPVPRRSAAGI